MNKLNNMKVKKKLIVCFAMVVFLASISGILGTVLLLRMDMQYSRALVENGFSQGDIGQFNTYLNKGSAVVRDVVLMTETADIQASQEELENIKKTTDAALVALKVNCQTAKELEYIAVIDEKMPLYREKRDEVVRLGLANRNDEAMELFRTEARPILNEIQQAAQDLASYNKELGNQVSSSLSAQSRVTVVIVIAVIVTAAVFSIWFAVRIAKTFSVPLGQINEASARLAKGDLNIEVSASSKDEIGEMTESFQQAVHMLKSYITEIDRNLTVVAGGNFDIDSSVDYKGDFKQIEEAIQTISKSLSDTLGQINEASDQVAIGASQMAENAQNLAEGATEQAGAVEELTATIETVTATTEESAQKADEASAKAESYEEQAEGGRKEIQELTEAMSRIIDTSKEIEKIIAQIEDIASQTNLLSLNASIEAARAGEAGRGFAVVADQIGKLAADSAQSAVNTRELIGKSIEEINNGNRITQKTAETLNELLEGIKELANVSRETSRTSQAQVQTMRDVEKGIEQISMVVQNNSASAEETSATSEELSAQSQSLKSLVGQFRLKRS